MVKRTSLGEIVECALKVGVVPTYQVITRAAGALRKMVKYLLPFVRVSPAESGTGLRLLVHGEGRIEMFIGDLLEQILCLFPGDWIGICGRSDGRRWLGAR